MLISVTVFERKGTREKRGYRCAVHKQLNQYSPPDGLQSRVPVCFSLPFCVRLRGLLWDRRGYLTYRESAETGKEIYMYRYARSPRAPLDFTIVTRGSCRSLNGT